MAHTAGGCLLPASTCASSRPPPLSISLACVRLLPHLRDTCGGENARIFRLSTLTINCPAACDIRVTGQRDERAVMSSDMPLHACNQMHTCSCDVEKQECRSTNTLYEYSNAWYTQRRDVCRCTKDEEGQVEEDHAWPRPQVQLHAFRHSTLRTA